MYRCFNYFLFVLATSLAPLKADYLQFPPHQPVLQTLTANASASTSEGSGGIRFQLVYRLEVLENLEGAPLLVEMRIQQMEARTSGALMEPMSFNTARLQSSRNITPAMAEALEEMVDNPILFEVSEGGMVSVVEAGAVDVLNGSYELKEALDLDESLFYSIIGTQFQFYNKDVQAGHKVEFDGSAGGDFLEVVPSLQITKVDSKGTHFNLQGKISERSDDWSMSVHLSGRGSWDRTNALLFKDNASGSLNLSEYGEKLRMSYSQSTTSRRVR